MRRLLSALKSRYELLVDASCSEQPFSIPSSAQRYFNSTYGFEYVTAIRKFVGDARRVLIVGDAGGRDYYSLKLLGKQPIVMDIARQKMIPQMIVADANAPLPFAPASFDAVVMAEVIEHLPEDFLSLKRLREITKDDGSLILTVPFYHDAERTHLRIHSPESIERLLQAAGWEMVAYIEKGGGLCRLIGWFPVRMTFHCLNLLSASLIGTTFYQRINRAVAAFDFALGARRRSLHRWSKAYGAFIRCAKGRALNWSEKNAAAFENAAHLRLAFARRGKQEVVAR
jgi:SAM-dependent methyltransferase